MPAPVRDPKWVDPTAYLAEASSTTLPNEASPVLLPASASPVVPPEPVTQVGSAVATRYVEALGLAVDLPQPVTALAAGAGQGESWVFERQIRGSVYGLTVTVSRRPLFGVVQLAAAATEIGSKDLTERSEEADLTWVVKAPDGPVQEVWAARRAGTASILAVCVAPVAYVQVALIACKSLRLASPPPVPL